ncbi:GGDEF domain-containing protein [Marinobacter zhejiangensis]|uniref:diguanylate cyclase n=1 Tax=Marinobacter zhejiangensis TaxID=488535 RepID=A0A1I4TE56_9GAMM|nr:GGDEF domain-containing protein [Marinobacter zhejiangensis]SFM75009.1 diguanylate cyclase (GGDEF) domain-containing protein [Marinobacter zhejiangensis]
MALIQHSDTPHDSQADAHIEGEIPVPTLITWLTLSAVCALGFFGFRGYMQGNLLTLYVLATFATLLTANALAYAITANEAWLRNGFIALITLLFSFLAVFAVEDGAGVLWLFAYPPVVFYIGNQRVGLYSCVGGWVALALLFSPLGELVAQTPYTATFRLLMLSALGFEMVSCYALDQSRRRSKQRLLQLASEFEFAAKHDALTGLFNRREGHSRIEDEYERYLRNNRVFSVLLMDIDLFKKVNDNFGHQAGDLMIKLVARTLVNECRKVDIVARWGGEEFLVVLPETDTREAFQIAERIRQSVASQDIEYGNQSIRSTISIGVASIEGSESIERVLQRADEALYRAKNLGRDKVCEHGDSKPVLTSRQRG